MAPRVAHKKWYFQIQLERQLDRPDGGKMHVSDSIYLKITSGVPATVSLCSTKPILWMCTIQRENHCIPTVQINGPCNGLMCNGQRRNGNVNVQKQRAPPWEVQVQQVREVRVQREGGTAADESHTSCRMNELMRRGRGVRRAAPPSTCEREMGGRSVRKNQAHAHRGGRGT
eukprot:gene13363-biopygen483